MAYHKSFQGHSTDEPLSGYGFHSISRKNGHCGQERSSGEDTAAHIYTGTHRTHRPSPSAVTVPRYYSSNHVTYLQNATDPRSNQSSLANHFKNLNTANIPDHKAHPTVPSRLPSSLPPPPPQQPLQGITFDAMQSPYHIGISHDNRSYHQYPVSYGLEASTSQHKLPENFGPNTFWNSVSQYNASQYDGGATSRKTSGFDGYESDDYGLGGENNYESPDIDMELDSDPEYPSQSADIFSPMEDHHHHHHTFHPHHPSSDHSSQRFTPSSEYEWHINDIDPENDSSSYPWRSAGKEHWQRTELPEPSWRHTETVDFNSWLHSSFYPLPSDRTTVYSDVRNTNNTPSDISSSASPLSPIDGLTHPVSQFPPIVASSLSTQALYPYSCHQMSGIGQPYPATGVYEPAAKSNTTTSAPFITTFLNGNGFVNAPSGTTAPDPILHAPRPVRPIPTVSFEDLAASISKV
ncbi:hypothetical protein L218DRAFT_939673 [Marasmius fiardii PR-910]|nr:hypothetical protein L218DRAFT_939673 [Marasmius fiardii PR-910]